MTRKRRRKVHAKQKAFEHLNISPLERHRRQGGTLIPPLATLPGKGLFASWIDAGLNEVLWAAILCGDLERKTYLDLFRQVVANAHASIADAKKTFLTHSVLSILADDVFDAFVTPLLNHYHAREALRSLLLLDCLPDRHHWVRHLETPSPETHSVFIMKAVATCFDHQSQEATDIRWLKICYFAVVCDRLRMALDEKRSREAIEEFRLYPDYGDQRKVRPSIRALELGLRMVQEGSEVASEVPPDLAGLVPKAWNEEFWKECFDKTPCTPVAPSPVPVAHAEEYLKELLEVYATLTHHFQLTIATTDVDARHDTTFALTLFAITLAIGAGRGNVHRRAEGRLILRTIVESYITLKFLENKDDRKIWLQHRN